MTAITGHSTIREGTVYRGYIDPTFESTHNFEPREEKYAELLVIKAFCGRPSIYTTCPRIY
jgi:hypothetical protein